MAVAGQLLHVCMKVRIHIRTEYVEAIVYLPQVLSLVGKISWISATILHQTVLNIHVRNSTV
jgi:hypothetical protein